jgi:hypothetical protein
MLRMLQASGSLPSVQADIQRATEALESPEEEEGLFTYSVTLCVREASDSGAAVQHARAESMAQFLRGVLEAHGPDLQALLLYAAVC